MLRSSGWLSLRRPCARDSARYRTLLDLLPRDFDLNRLDRRL